MKTEIINFFNTDRSYRGGVLLVQQYSPKLGLKKQLNIHPQSDYLKGVVFEELRELAGIKCSELNAMLAIPLSKTPPTKIAADTAKEVSPNPEPHELIQGTKNKKKAPTVKKPSRKK